ncbi:TPA: ABC transporter permease [Streptococcus equi subsp. zooepidemicus]|uniref:Bacitracin export permease protein BceB n=2 Tax=Streptococcus equi TaxID=1336 RepID=A0A922NT04_9STRE|nr:ABC transporter permease [Streptococcus equi]HEL0245970.1 ABC transporter permease [Streptococcus equi subsp. zooepidemicus]HEL1011107.1 ABC transporter permease [Streptococcus equi subsp. ruminatorum]KED03918.1 bacitracin export permease protein BceB [Streptococcus equi subsp. ruminatorum CECT 5772]HEL1013075.1 ABC transporter permease [Streptococcus equi subsp. ruminatorum]HEL1023007.1 ABC transporter permease [Streptococcus equi subsp. ruminatorum CECT 5772]
MFYLKLAWNNLRKSLSVTAPFLLASTVLYMLNCIVLIIMMSPVSESMRHGFMLLGLAIFVLIIFATIIEIYSYNFLLKQRSREFGLYNILGMNKKQVGLVSTIELVFMYLGTVVVGSILSAIFSHVFYLIFANLVRAVHLELQINPVAFIYTTLIFAAIFGLLEVVGLIKIRKTSPLMLFRHKEQGEKEPKGNLLLAALSIILLSIGYYISLSSTKLTALDTLYRFFIAVIIVIIGTYLFYISFMTWHLKRRRQNKAYFYQPEHFVSTSQMIFRMKQNAVGLANITLLAVMAFVAIATTTALYANSEAMSNQLFPKNTHINFDNSEIDNQKEVFNRLIVEKTNKPASDFLVYYSSMVSFEVSQKETIVVTKESLLNPSPVTTGYIYLVTQDDFRALGNQLPELKDNQTAFFKQRGDSQLRQLDILGKSYTNVKNLTSVTFPEAANTYNGAVLVVKDMKTLKDIQDSIQGINHTGGRASISAYADLTKADLRSISDDKGIISDGDTVIGHIETKEEYLRSTYVLTGGFLFTGFLLGLSFVLGAALIIYYKQYSEGYEDKKSYNILQEVGMSKQQVKKTINSQIVLVFFMPIAMAVLHFCVALVMLKQMLFLFGVLDTNLIYLVSALTIAVIIVIYFTIYRITSKTYYNIIER